MIYFDNAATTFPKPKSVISAMTQCLESEAVNAGRGIYPLAQKADKIIFQTRLKVLKLLGMPDGKVIFSPSATVAINQILLGMHWSKGDVVYTTPLEHNSVSRTLFHISQKYGVKTHQLYLDHCTYEYNLKKIEEQFDKNPPKALVLTHISNVIGLVTPIIEVSKLAKQHGAYVIIDGAQGGPLAAIKEDSNLIDYYVFSGHKTFYGPFGIAGFILNNKDLQLDPILFGGTGSHSEMLEMPESEPFRYETGSHNIVAITGLNAACDWLLDVGPEKILQKEKRLMKSMLDKLKMFNEITLYVGNEEYHQGLFSFNLNGYASQEVGTILGEHFDIAVRAGLHCAPMAHQFLNTLPKGTVRVSFGYFNEEDEVDIFADAIKKIIDS